MIVRGRGHASSDADRKAPAICRGPFPSVALWLSACRGSSGLLSPSQASLQPDCWVFLPVWNCRVPFCATVHETWLDLFFSGMFAVPFGRGIQRKQSVQTIRPDRGSDEIGPTFQSSSAYSQLHRLLPAPASFSSCDLLSLREPRLERRLWECAVFLIKVSAAEKSRDSRLPSPHAFTPRVYSNSNV